MEAPRLTPIHDTVPAEAIATPAAVTLDPSETHRSFDDRFVVLFDAHYRRLFRFLDRLSGDPDLAADIAQDAFLRLYERGSLPDAPTAWLVSVAMNLFRNASAASRRRLRLLTPDRAERVLADPPPSPREVVEAGETQRIVRSALDRIPERDRRMLLLRAEGFSYRDIATALAMNEASVGTLLARANHAFRRSYQDALDAPR